MSNGPVLGYNSADYLVQQICAIIQLRGPETNFRIFQILRWTINWLNSPVQSFEENNIWELLYQVLDFYSQNNVDEKIVQITLIIDDFVDSYNLTEPYQSQHLFDILYYLINRTYIENSHAMIQMSIDSCIFSLLKIIELNEVQVEELYKIFRESFEIHQKKKDIVIMLDENQKMVNFFNDNQQFLSFFLSDIDFQKDLIDCLGISNSLDKSISILFRHIINNAEGAMFLINNNFVTKICDILQQTSKDTASEIVYNILLLSYASNEVCEYLVNKGVIASPKLYRYGYQTEETILHLISHLACESYLPPEHHVIQKSVAEDFIPHFLESDEPEVLLEIFNLITKLSELNYHFEIEIRLNSLCESVNEEIAKHAQILHELLYPRPS